MAKQTETNVPHPTTIQFTAMYSFVKMGTNPPNTIAVNTSLDKSKKYFAKVSFTVLSQLRASFFSSCCLLKFPIAKLVISYFSTIRSYTLMRRSFSASRASSDLMRS